MLKKIQSAQFFEIGETCWLKGTDDRKNMRVTVVDCKMDGNGDWSYQLKDNKGDPVDGGKFFPDEDLSNSGE